MSVLAATGKLVQERNLLVSSRKDVRTDVALKHARAELAGESGFTVPPIENRSAGLPSLLDELLALQVRGHSPIIVVPSSANSRSRLTLLNAARFLQDGVYQGGVVGGEIGVPCHSNLVERTIGGNVVRFRVFDDTSKFRKDDWKALVAVFTDGKRWQFTGWPFRSETDLFTSVQAFHLRYAEDGVDLGISTIFRVKQLLLQKSARHSDPAVMVEFWKVMETFLAQPRTRRFSSTQRLP